MQTDNISWRWEKNVKRKHITLIINDCGDIIVRTPIETSLKKVELIICEKREWLKKSMQKQKLHIYPKLPQFAEHGMLYFLGKQYNFTLIIAKKASFEFNNGKYIIYADNKTEFEKILYQWYKLQTQIKVEEAIENFKALLFKQPLTIGFKYYKRRWGSCDNHNNIMFNILLSLHSTKYINYIVAHELAHIKEKNHSKKFYLEGERILSGFKNLDKLMRV